MQGKIMKITQLFKIYWPDNGGGIAKVMEDIADGFRDCEQEILVCQDSGKKKSADDTYKGIAVHRCRQLFELASTPVSLQFLRDVRKRTRNSDLVIYHFPYPMADLAVLLGLYSGRLIVWWHCGFEKYPGLAFLYLPLVRHTLKKADRIIVSSKENIRHSKLLRQYCKKCEVVPFCVSNAYLQRGRDYAAGQMQQNPEETGRPAQESLSQKMQNQTIRILFIGRLVWYKGCDVLLKAFAQIRHPDCSLVLVGGGPLEHELKNLAAALKLNRVEFTGIVSEEEKMRRIEACDFLVLPSISKAEAFAVVQLEAMAFGKPVINTALQSGVPDVSIDGVTGITVKPGSVRELARAMDRLSYDDRLRKRYGKNALLRVQKRYTQQIMVERYKKIFQQLLEHG